MKGVVLTGGTGSRLNPLTRVTNKHLLPIYNEPMVYYPIQTLVNAGIEEIQLVTGGKNAGDSLRLLSNGRDFGVKHINYTYQEGKAFRRINNLRVFNALNSSIPTTAPYGAVGSNDHFCASQAFKEDTRDLHSFPICTPLISPLRNRIFTIAAPSSLSNSGSNSIAAGVIICSSPSASWWK